MNTHMTWAIFFICLFGVLLYREYADTQVEHEERANNHALKTACVEACTAHNAWGVYAVEDGTCSCVELTAPPSTP